jgi:hypothetical protein
MRIPDHEKQMVNQYYNELKEKRARKERKKRIRKSKKSF